MKSPQKEDYDDDDDDNHNGNATLCYINVRSKAGS